MTLLDLFSGIGGMSLGLERAGMRTVAFCEVDPFCRAVLEHHWPGVAIHSDVRTLRGADVGAVDLVAGGFPCQPVSLAGRRQGQADSRWLWPEMLRIVREVRPRWVLAENVPGLRTLGADRVLEDLEAAGYSCWPLVVGADDAGAPHRRKRVWIVAHRSSSRREVGSGAEGRKAKGWEVAPIADRSGSTLAHSDTPGRIAERSSGLLDGEGSAPGDDADGRGERPVGEPTGPRLEGQWSDAGEPEESEPRGAGDGTGLGDTADSMPQEPESVDSFDGEWSQKRRGELLDSRAGAASGTGGGDHAPGDGRHAARPAGGAVRWPARPGQPQHEWEEPRLAYGAERTGKPGESRAAQRALPTGNGEVRSARRAQQPLGSPAHGLPERLVRRANREALRAYGNSVVPQVVEAIGRAIITADAILRAQ